MVNQAIQAELSRVREAKRNTEGMVALLRSDMEQGKIHLRVSECPKFRREVAEKVVSEAHPGYHGQGYYYADPVEGKVYYKETTAAWNPWNDSIGWRIVGVEALVNQDSNDFSPEVDWDVVDFPYREMVTAYLEAEDEEFEENGDVPEWVDRRTVIEFASDDDRWSQLIEQIENTAYEEAVSLALFEMLDEIVIQPLS